MSTDIQQEYIIKQKSDIIKKIAEAVQCDKDPLPICKIPESIAYKVLKPVSDEKLQWKIVEEFGLF